MANVYGYVFLAGCDKSLVEKGFFVYCYIGVIKSSQPEIHKTTQTHLKYFVRYVLITSNKIVFECHHFHLSRA